MNISFLNWIGLEKWFISEGEGMKQLNKYLALIATGAAPNVKEAYAYNFIDTTEEESGEVESERRFGYAMHLLKGVMMSEDALCSGGMRSFCLSLKQADMDKRVKGHIINVNCGGGQAMAGQMLMNGIKVLRKPVIVHADLIASAAVLGTIYADEIILTGPIAQIGSVGAMVSVSKEVLRQVKEDFVTLYSRRSERKNEEFRGMLEGDNTLMIDFITELDEVFMSIVEERRGELMPKDLKEGVLSGAMFMGREGVKCGLADGIGDIEYVLRRMEILVNK